MVLNSTHWLISALATLLLGLSMPALAHEDHKKQATPKAATNVSAAKAVPRVASEASHTTMSEMMDHGPEATETSFAARLANWLGRLHPILVHFPIAFFPAALFTAIVGRRRASFGAPVRFLVVAGGIVAPVAAVLGWLDAWGMDPDPLLAVHRWLGVAIGALAGVLAVWAWRRPEQDRGGVMLASLTVLTAAIIVQGWYGGALVHGIGHLNW